jgi:hypothetical protein
MMKNAVVSALPQALGAIKGPVLLRRCDKVRDLNTFFWNAAPRVGNQVARIGTDALMP